jgi:hypothetical protein
MDLMEMGWGDMDCTHLAQDRGQWRALVNTVMNIRVPQNDRKFCTPGGFARAQLHAVHELVSNSSMS